MVILHFKREIVSQKKSRSLSWKDASLEVLIIPALITTDISKLPRQEGKVCIERTWWGRCAKHNSTGIVGTWKDARPFETVQEGRKWKRRTYLSRRCSRFPSTCHSFEPTKTTFTDARGAKLDNKYENKLSEGYATRTLKWMIGKLVFL